jgi:hypothetical protein
LRRRWRGSQGSDGERDTGIGATETHHDLTILAVAQIWGAKPCQRRKHFRNFTILSDF